MVGAGQLLSKPTLSPPLNVGPAARPANEAGRARVSYLQNLKPACRTAVHRQHQHICSATAAGEEASPSPAAPVEAEITSQAEAAGPLVCITMPYTSRTPRACCTDLQQCLINISHVFQGVDVSLLIALELGESWPATATMQSFKLGPMTPVLIG